MLPGSNLIRKHQELAKTGAKAVSVTSFNRPMERPRGADESQHSARWNSAPGTHARAALVPDGKGPVPRIAAALSSVTTSGRASLARFEPILLSLASFSVHSR